MFKIVVEFLFSISLAANALLFIPQIIKLYKTKRSEDVSLFMFLCFDAMQFISILYGYIKEDYVMMLGFGFSLITCGATTVLVWIYKDKKT